MKISFIAALSLLSATLAVHAADGTAPKAAPDSESNWNFGAGLGVAEASRYPGAKTVRVLPIPLLSASYKDIFFADVIKGVGVQHQVLPGLTLSGSVGASFDGRKSKDSSRLKGMPDIKVAPALLFGADYVLGNAFLDLNLSERLGNEQHRGGLFSMDLGYNLWNTTRLNLGAGITAHAMDKDYARNFFGVSEAQSETSGLPVFAAKAGLKDAGVFAQGQYHFDEKWTLSSRIAFTKLSAEAARSPIVERKVQPQFFLAATRAF